jgi:hypothetical protein
VPLLLLESNTKSIRRKFRESPDAQICKLSGPSSGDLGLAAAP